MSVLRAGRPPRPFIAAAALIRAARAANAAFTRTTMAAQTDTIRCPITECNGAPMLTASLDVAYRRTDAATVSANWYCPECGITVTVENAERG